MPDFLDAAIGTIKVAQVLGCPAGELAQQPRALVLAAQVLMAVEAKLDEKRAKAAEKARKKKAHS